LCRHHAGEWRLRPAGAGCAVVAPCGADCVALLSPRVHGQTRCAACRPLRSNSGR